MGDPAQDGDAAGDEPPTAHALPPGALARRAQAAALKDTPSPGPHVSQQIAIQTLREEQAAAALHMIRVGRGLAIAALLPMPFVDGNRFLEILLTLAIALALAVGALTERRIRNRSRFTERTTLVLALSASPGIFIAVLYFGILSAVQLFPVLALNFFCRREDRRSALALYILNAGTQALFAILMLTHLLADPGLVTPRLPTGTLIAGFVLLQLAFVAAYVLGRGAHQASREAIEKMQKAMTLAAQREALLQEARADLDRALAIDAAGRFSEHTFGQYRLGNVIGRGGMGEVYEAFHIESGQPAAVKLLAKSELGNPQSVERFLRELRAIRGLESKHVVRVLATSSEQDEIPYLVMEKLAGHDLAHHLRSGRMPPSALLEMLDQVGAAVEEAWAKGIVHRDLKPQNLFLADGIGWKVLDFGVAALEESSGTLTQGKVVGTPAYMAPEQARGEKVDHRADVYALAAIAYRWLTGRPVCSGKDLHNALYQTVHVMPQKPSTLAELHEDVDRALIVGLVKEPADRWERVADLREALASALAGDLDPKIRRRGADLEARHPWGAVRG
ncbi:MAG TPA: serine/threonine-protein kinase [Kofleriaceae bacterium]|nr:serine/threonine-protein kinase [Kofleriaceae bacterium]